MKKVTSMKEMFDFVSKKNDVKSIDLFYRKNKIKKEILNFGISFISALFTKIDETYLGNDYISSEDDINNHFTWCFKMVAAEVKKNEGINLKIDSLLFEYLLDYQTVFFYGESIVSSTLEDRIFYFKFPLTMNYDKTAMDLELLKQYHEMLESSIFYKN